MQHFISTQLDPFNHKRKLDFHDQYHLTALVNFGIEMIELNSVKEFGDEIYWRQRVFKDYSLLTQVSDDYKYEQEIINSLFDVRFELLNCVINQKKYCFTTFYEIAEDSHLVQNYKYITPNFMKHFNIEGVNEKDAMDILVKFQSLQLGFHASTSSIMCQETQDRYGYDEVPYLRYRCLVGTNEY